MKHSTFFWLAGLFAGLLLFSGCFGAADQGPALFNENEPAEETPSPTEDVTPAPVESFGSLVPGTLCVTQLHGGCVPSDYTLFDAQVLGLRFMRPLAWVNTAANDTEVVFTPSSESENDPTQLIVARSVAPILENRKASLQGEVTDAGQAITGSYEVTWEIYDGTWNNQPVKSEWTTFTLDEYNPWINFVFVVVSEPENFLEDQAALKGAVSSVVANTPELE